MSDHAKLSPSSAERWMACPGSIRLSEGIPDESSIHADEGTFAHDIAAQCLEHGAKGAGLLGAAREKLEELRGTVSSCGRFTVDDEMIDALDLYLRAVFLTLDFAGKRGATVQLLVEEKVHAIKGEVWGTADAILLIGDELHVFDLKYGSGKWVGVKDNPQLLIYAIGSLALFDTAKVRTVVIHVVQPRHSHPRWRSSLYETYYVEKFAAFVRLAAMAASDDGARLEPGDHCQFCRAKHKCPALRERAQSEAAALFKPRTQPPAPTDMTPEMIGKALSADEIWSDWIKAVRKLAYEEADKVPSAIPGWKLVNKGGAHRKFKDPAKAERVIKVLKVDPYAERKLATPKTVLDRCGKNKKLKQAVAALVYQPDAGTVLVPESDPREAIRALFQPVEKTDG